MTHICDSRPTIIKNDITDDYSILKTGYEACDCTETSTLFNCGCTLVVEITSGVRTSRFLHCDAHIPIEELLKK